MSNARVSRKMRESWKVCSPPPPPPPPPPINNDDPKLGGKFIYLDISLNLDKSIKIDSKLRYILTCHMTRVYILFGHLYSKYWLIFGIKTLRKPHYY